jgi:hypothetical protein
MAHLSKCAFSFFLRYTQFSQRMPLWGNLTGECGRVIDSVYQFGGEIMETNLDVLKTALDEAVLEALTNCESYLEVVASIKRAGYMPSLNIESILTSMEVPQKLLEGTVEKPPDPVYSIVWTEYDLKFLGSRKIGL